MVTTDHKGTFLEQLCSEVEKHLSGEESQNVQHFARIFYETFPIEDLQGRNLDDIFGSLLGSWRFLEEFVAGQPKIRIFNPEFEKHGWLGTHTVVTIHARNLPFILDSVRVELNRRNITIHTIHYSAFTTERDAEHKLMKFSAVDAGTTHETASDHQEALFYLEINRHTDPNYLRKLREALQEVLQEVRVVVDDFVDMRASLASVVADLPTDHPSGELSLEEVQELLVWLHENHFTFLGYEKLLVTREVTRTEVRRVEHSELGLLKLRKSSAVADIEDLLRRESLQGTMGLLEFAKSSQRSRVHRYAYADYLTVRCFDRETNTEYFHRFLGLLTSVAYTASVFSVPVVRQKAEKVMARSGLSPESHERKELLRTIEVHPRDEFFHADIDELTKTIIAIHQIQERRQVRLFVRKNRDRKFISCLVYTPKDIYRTELRAKIEAILVRAFNASESQFSTFFSESVLTRTHFTFKVDPNVEPDFDLARLREEVIEASKRWDDHLREALLEEFGEEKGAHLAELYDDAFSPGYEHDYDTRVAVNDIKKIATMSAEHPIAMSFYRVVDEGNEILHFRVFNFEDMLALSDMLPILENLGLRVVGERPYNIRRGDGRNIWLHEFSLIYSLSNDVNINDVRTKFQDAFVRVWNGDAESDSFNKLLLGTKLGWREIALLRAYSRYMKQIRVSFSGDYIAETLGKHLSITQLLFDHFHARFSPDFSGEANKRAAAEAELEANILQALDAVENLNEDRIIRWYLDLMNATLRTNYYQLTADGESKAYFSFKFFPDAIAEIPKPRPLYEIFVYSPRVEGVHLRGGRVARGGLRWSDRPEDFRTEVLGLVKAQQVKNAVIVPVGAKGGFVAKRSPSSGSREEIQAEGIACYQTFVRGMLDLTDNLIEGAVAPPARVVRKDEDDTYLVVAADKGTATFSDIANDISLEYGFWLGDAFASGGSIGYDHKKMGITARGAWVSVERHFREKGLNTRKQEFTVVGIGDMAGDVFGNGMLLSEHIRLVCAFNHLHIFVDPDPVAASAFQERKRLFELPRSSWADYDKSLLSAGGGIFLRSAKSIDISAEMKQRFNISKDKLTPNQLISAVLKAPVDLLWNGGIGTYVKASSESHADVGDKANDGLRVNAADLRCKVIGEGGNLGTTQLSRVEYGLHGGASNTDFIDNAGGVDCSDHEVNIKIVLNDMIASGDMTEKQRRQLLEDMTDDVAQLVLKNNYRQTQAISIAESEAYFRLGEYKRLISSLESRGKLDRALEFIPDDEVLLERKLQHVGLTRPELSVLISYVKGILKEELAQSDIPDDDYMSRAIESAFPQRLLESYPQRVYTHKLRKEIVATQIANDMVNQMGITFVERLNQSTGMNSVDIARAYITARDVFMMHVYWEDIEALDYQVPAQLQLHLMRQLMRLVRRGSRWFLRNRRSRIDPAVEVKHFQPVVKAIGENSQMLLQGRLKHEWEIQHRDFVEQGVPEKIANYLAGSSSLYASLGIAEAAVQTGVSVSEVSKVFFALGEELELDWFGQQIADLKIDNHWQALAREAYRDDLEWQQSAITIAVINIGEQAGDLQQGIPIWFQKQEKMLDRWRSMINDLQGAEIQDFAMFSVALRELLDLAQSSTHCC